MSLIVINISFVEQELVYVCGSNIFLSYYTCKTISANVPNLDNVITSCKVLMNFAEYQLAAQDLLFYKNNS
jgi:hypothetical protein